MAFFDGPHLVYRIFSLGRQGAGKTTQCPQYLLERALLQGRGDAVNVICTQPRRVAATSVAERVSEEMADRCVEGLLLDCITPCVFLLTVFFLLVKRLGNLVGYQIRMEAVRSRHTKLLFCTTGVLLRRLQDDNELKSVTHVIVDEVHERQVQTDVLLIALRQLLATSRKDLKVILVR
jgi:HrpA-like RNA helicase